MCVCLSVCTYVCEFVRLAAACVLFYCSKMFQLLPLTIQLCTHLARVACVEPGQRMWQAAHSASSQGSRQPRQTASQPLQRQLSEYLFLLLLLFCFFKLLSQ